MNMKYMKNSIAFAAAAAFAFSAPAAAQYQQPAPDSKTPASSTTAKQTGANSQATTFMMKAAQGGKTEVELGQLAQSKGTDPQVKSYGQMLVTDHSKANDDLMSIASKKSVTLPSDLSGAQKSTKDRLDKMTGAAFDRAFMTQMIRDHQADIKEFEQAAKGSDQDVKAFAEGALPTLRHHLEEAQRIQKTLGAAGNPGAPGRR